MSWESGSTPWLRREQPEATADAGAVATCYFCGRPSVKRSIGDYDADPGRLRVYCTNPACAAREVIVLVQRDGADSRSRADVRAIERIDNTAGTPARRPDGLPGSPPVDDIVAARTSRAPFTLDVPGSGSPQ